MDDFATMGRRVRERRLRFGLTTRELAEQAGVSRNTLVRIEAGQPIAPASAEKIRTALSMFTDQIELPIVEAPFSVHRFEDSRWNVNVPKENYRRGIADDDPRHVDDPAERRRLGALGFQPCFTAVLNSEFPGGIGSHAMMELHGRTHITQHYGEEFVYCIRGAALITVDDVPCVLRQGDTMCFDATVPHIYEPAPDSDDPTPLLLVVVAMRPGERPHPKRNESL